MCNGCILHVGYQGQHRYRMGGAWYNVGVGLLVAYNENELTGWL